MNWQPIEEAPKDGTELLLYGIPAGEIGGIEDDPVITTGLWSSGKSDYPGDDWWDVSATDAYACWIRATHFMLLPEPPK